MADVQVKGMALRGVTAALKPAFERKPELVPPALHHYLREEIVPNDWYSFDEYLTLMRILGGLMDPEKSKGDVYRAIGILGAQRDLRGVEENLPEDQHLKQTGQYKGALAGVTGLATLVRRGLHLRELYYSRGYYKVKRVAERKLVITLHDFPACAELCAVSTGYLIEVFRSAEVGVWVDRVSCRGEGDPDCRWELRFEPGTDVTDLRVFD